MDELTLWLIYLIIAAAIGIIILVLSPRYVVVPASEAHVVVRRKSRTVYCSRKGYLSSYWYFPILHKRSILPLNASFFLEPSSRTLIHTLYIAVYLSFNS